MSDGEGGPHATYKRAPTMHTTTYLPEEDKKSEQEADKKKKWIRYLSRLHRLLYAHITYVLVCPISLLANLIRPFTMILQRSRASTHHGGPAPEMGTSCHARPNKKKSPDSRLQTRCVGCWQQGKKMLGTASPTLCRLHYVCTYVPANTGCRALARCYRYIEWPHSSHSRYTQGLVRCGETAPTNDVLPKSNGLRGRTLEVDPDRKTSL